jgi:hypothetical protein
MGILRIASVSPALRRCGSDMLDVSTIRYAQLYEFAVRQDRIRIQGWKKSRIRIGHID